MREQLAKLHCPSLDFGHPLVIVTRRVAQLCIEYLPECTGFPLDELHRGILAIEMNIFSGGHVFATASRINHSCFPNVVSVAAKDCRTVRALRPIKEGEEVLSSYLGKELLLPTEIRRHHLWRSKCFWCDCRRCMARTDEMRAIPCKRCAEATFGHDTVEVGTDLVALVKFLLQPNAGHASTTAILAAISQASEVRDDLDPCLSLPHFSFCSRRSDLPWVPYAQFQGDAWFCERCGEALRDQQLLLSTERWLNRLAERTLFSPEMTTALGTIRSRAGARIPMKMVTSSFLTTVIDLVASVCRVLGPRHWTVQWARLLFVDLMISRLDYMGNMERLRVCRRREGEEEPAFMLLSMLKDLWDWLGSLNLAHDPSCFLHARTSEAICLLEPMLSLMNPECSALFEELRIRLSSSPAQVEMLPMQPLLVQGSIF